ncbi:MAG: NrpR regulatory domain-containing protein [Methanomicrobiales archaeon]
MAFPLRFITHRIEDYALQVTYRPLEGTGRIIYNLSLIRETDVEAALPILRDTFAAGLWVSDRLRLFSPGEEIDGYTIPAGRVGICTVCSITMDALLLRRGVPLNPLGGGLVEVRDRVPLRFTSFIRYDATTIDPTQLLISPGSPAIGGVLQKGDGTILANLRECHMEAEPVIGAVLDDLAADGFTGVLDVGNPNSPLLSVPVTPEYMAVAMVSGTNMLGALREAGIPVAIHAMKGTAEIDRLGRVTEY